MRLFPATSTHDVVTTAVACIAPAVAWLSFWTTYRAKLAVQRRERRRDLAVLHASIEAIRPWAGTEYKADHHDASWYDPTFGVNDFPWEYVERFNRVVGAEEFPPTLTAAVVQLEAASQRFHTMLVRHREFQGQADPGVLLTLFGPGSAVNRVLTPAIKGTRTTGSPLSDTFLEELPMPEGARAWLRELYRRNKAIHVEGIGKAGDPQGLHEALRAASLEVGAATQRLQLGDDPRWFILGHVLAGTFVIVGLSFLADFGMRVTHRVRGVRAPVSDSSSASYDSRSLNAAGGHATASMYTAAKAGPDARVSASADTAPAGSRGTAPAEGARPRLQPK